jgi:glycosyltransferase involved in cell wall biosynthesis
VRILHVIPYMHASAGGPPVVVENFIRETNKFGHLSEIISTPLFCNHDQRILLERLNTLARTVFVSPSRSLCHLHPETWRQLYEGIYAADIVHLHTLWHPINDIARRVCARQCRPYVLMPHGMLDPHSLMAKRWRKAVYLWAIEHRNIADAKRIIFTTSEEARLATSQSLSLPQTAVIPLGGDGSSEAAASLSPLFLERFPKARGRRQLLFLGRLHAKKGLDRILTVLPFIAQRFPDVLLTIVGDGAIEFETMLKNLIKTRDLENSVMITGRLDGAMKWGAYASAELFLLPSRQENFGIAVAEAMFMGIPVIISDRVNIWPYVKNSGAGIVLDDSRIEIQLKEALISLLTDPNKIRLSGMAGQNYARRNLTWRRAASQLLACYEEVLAITNS